MGQSNRRPVRALRRKALAVVIGQCLATGIVGAVDITVDTGNIGVTDDGLCSISEAILNANSDSQFNSTDCPAGNVDDRIILSSPFDIVATAAFPSLGSALPTVDSNITIDGGGGTIRRADGSGPFRILGQSDGNLIINNLTLANGEANYGYGGGIFTFGGNLTLNLVTVSGSSARYFGGGVRFAGDTLTITSSSISGNTAYYNAGGLSVDNGFAIIDGSSFVSNTAGADGGGLYLNNTTATLTDVTIDMNGADRDGGGLFAATSDVTLAEGGIEGNQAAGGGGGVFTTASNLTLQADQQVLNNQSDGDGGGIKLVEGTLTARLATISGNSATGYEPLGGGIFAGGGGTVTLLGSTVSGNSAFNGGGIRLESYRVTASVLTIADDTGTMTSATISGNTAARDGGGISVGNQGGASGGPGVTVSITNATIANNLAQSDGEAYECGGGLEIDRSNTTITNSNIVSNTAAYCGGAIRLFGNESVQLIDTVIENNVALIDVGGAIDSSLTDIDIQGGAINNNTAVASGGGINFSTDNSLSLRDVTLSGNSSDAEGGALFISINSDAEQVDIENVVVTDNAATQGGGIYANRGIVNVSNVTFSGNAATTSGGAIESDEATLTMSHLTLASNAAPLGGSLFLNEGSTALSNSIIADAGCEVGAGSSFENFSNLVETGLSCGTVALPVMGDPMLGPLADNGGPTQTHALMPGSAAIDSASAIACAAEDQRGLARESSACDVGAYERVTSIQVDAMSGVGAVVIADDGMCSIVEAVNNANNNNQGSTATDECEPGQGDVPNLIVLPEDATFTFTVDTGGRALPSITGALTIDGNNSTLTRDVTAPEFGMIAISGSGDLTLNDVTVTNGVSSLGGVFSNYGNLTASGCTFSNNTATSSGGVLRGVGGTSTFTNCNLLDNSAGTGGGALLGQNGATVMFLDSTLSGNSSGGSAGALWQASGTLTLDNTMVSDNIAGGGPGNGGGGVFGQAEAQINLLSSTFSGNSATNIGGAIWQAAGDLTIENSTFNDNTAIQGGAMVLSESPGRVTSITNSTLSSNSASSSGGAIRSDAEALMMSHLTFVDNVAPSGASIDLTRRSASLTNSIIAGDGCLIGPTATMTNVSNLIEDAASCGTAVTPVTGDPMLGPLDDNGGPTRTHALLAGSAAIDSASTAECEATDQRDLPRDSAACDVGAFEVQAVDLDIIFKNGFE